MSNIWKKYSILFIALVLFQVLVLNYFEISRYIYPMIYVMLILDLPIKTNQFTILTISILLGVILDSLSDTFGLHTSSLILVAYARPIVLKFIRPRDGYDKITQPNLQEMGKFWYAEYAFIILFIHHLWFFSLELFRFDLIGIIILKTLLSSIFSLTLILVVQYLFYKPVKY